MGGIAEVLASVLEERDWERQLAMNKDTISNETARARSYFDKNGWPEVFPAWVRQAMIENYAKTLAVIAIHKTSLSINSVDWMVLAENRVCLIRQVEEDI